MELNETIVNILQKAIELAEQTGEFVLDQSPIILQEFFIWRTLRHSVIILICIIVIIISIKLKKRVLNFFNNDYWDSPTIIFDVITIGVIIGAITELFDLLFIIVAPRLYLIEYISKLTI